MFSIFRLSSIVQPLMDGSRYVCWVLLAFYMWRVLLFVFKGKKEGGARRDGMREAMAMAYTLVAAYFILSATKAVQPFMVNILDSVSSLRPQPQAEELTLLELMSAFVFTAFICNFSRSLWMLKSLDHALFEPVPQWGELSGRSAWKRAAEFATRTVAAVLFILVEFRLERLAATQTQSFVPNENLVLAGKWGLLLYATLFVWWWVGYWIAGAKMPKMQVWYYLAGAANSFFIFKYAGNPNSNDAVGLLLFIVVVWICAIYMLVYIFWDPVRGFGNYITTMRKRLADAKGA